MTDRNDFFADLERQLVTATTERRPRLRRARARRAALLSTILVAVLAAGGGLAAAVTSTNGADSDGGGPAGATTRTEQTQEQTVAIDPATGRTTPEPGTYTVAILNGTTVPGLARGVANRLTNAKHKIGNVTNAATQDRSATLVEFAPGHRAEANAVAEVIDVAPSAVEPESAGSKAIAGAAAAVVVTVGADQNTSPQHSG
ncbi:hypothetical protein DSM104299_05552 [Baekduia alba]|uniref:LytR C-terminal domain-containing protein n=1 Tax=Baekduia alba TaxID=2997333 RepID=UPI002341D3E9|nr:LytR C-terminal domain-containing protein [Baekduia alba]WCB96784.1 hypothetical protein DSM104299_05552 [Baekduia alba]